MFPALKKLSGFKAAYFMVDRKTGEGLGVTLWESEEAMRSSEEAVKQLREQVVSTHATHVTGVDRYEVVAQA